MDTLRFFGSDSVDAAYYLRCEHVESRGEKATEKGGEILRRLRSAGSKFRFRMRCRRIAEIASEMLV